MFAFPRAQADKQKEQEEKAVEEAANKRIEELVAKRVQEELERRKDEIEAEVCECAVCSKKDFTFVTWWRIFLELST